MSWYRAGTVSVSQGSNAVIGVGTAFISNARVGDAFRGPDGGWYEVTNIASNTALSIAPNYQGPTLASGGYSLAPMQGYVKESADALRLATKLISSGVTEMQDQVAAAIEAAESAGQSKAVATEQAGIATGAANLSTGNKDAAQLAAQQGQASAQASGAAAARAENARNSTIQSEQAAAASAAAAQDYADRAEEVTEGKAASGDNNDIASLRALTADGFDRIRQGLAALVGASASTDGDKGLVPAPGAGPTRFLSSLGTWLTVNASASWGGIAGTLSAQTDLQAALNAKSALGVVQTYQDLTSNRAANTTYTNDTPNPILVIISKGGAQAANGSVVIVDGYEVLNLTTISTLNAFSAFTFLVPGGKTYRFNITGAATLVKWTELR